MKRGRVLVTGAGGYVGSVLCRQLLGLGYAVRGLDALLFGDHGVRGLFGRAGFEFMAGDMCDAEVRALALEEVSAVVHLAAIVGDPACKRHPEAATALMDVASRALHAEALEAGVGVFVFASTCSNYGLMDGDALLSEGSPLQPQSHYARLKVGFEEYLLANDAPARMRQVILRFATAYGLSPRMRFDLTVNHFSLDLYSGMELQVFGKDQWRPYCHVEDLAAAVTMALAHAHVAGVFNVGDSRENYTKAMIVEEVLRQCPQGRVVYGPQADVDGRNYRVDFSKAAWQLGFQVKHRVPDGVSEIVAALAGGQFGDAFEARYRN